jgi:hypothetical protein
MKRDTVTSSNLRSVGYDKAKKVLEVEFRTGAIYQYEDVPEAIYTQLLRAPSHGEFFSRYVRNDFKYKRVK